MTDNSQFPSAQPYPPPVGEISDDDHSAVWSFLAGLVEEAVEQRQEWIQLADDALNIYAYGKADPPDPGEIVINDIQQAVISATDIQTKEPPAVTLEPVEVGDVPQVYWAGPPELAQQLQILPQEAEPWVDETGQQQPPVPLDDPQVQFIDQLIEAGQLKDDAVVKVNDELVADTYQGVFDVYWERSQADLFLRQNLLETNIQGWTFGLYEFDDDRLRHCLRHVSIKQVYIDPTVRDVADASYAGIDLVIDATEAKKLYPNLAGKIDENAKIGIPDVVDGLSKYGQAFDNKNFRRPMVVLRTFWLRNQEIAMSVDEAIGGGHVEEREIPNGPSGNDGTGAGTGELPQVDSGTPDNNPAEPAGVGEGDAAGSVAPQGEAGVADVLADPGPDADPIQRGLFLRGTDTEVDHTHPHWPQRLVLRQITALAGMIIDDRECEHADIPLIHNVNLPIPGRPWGMGEPFRLKLLQEARSRMVNAIVDHTDYLRHPMASMPQSLHAATMAEYGSVRAKPGRVLIVPDDMWTRFDGKLDTWNVPPPLPEATVEAQQLLKGELNEQSGHTNEVRGITSNSQQSGKAIELLQTAASSMIGFKSKRTGDVVNRLAKLMLHSLVWRLTPDQLGMIVAKYPPHILEAIHQRARQIEWDVKVIIASGNGTVLEAKKAQAREDFQAGIISHETVLETLGYDVRQEQNRLAKQGAQQALAAQQQAVAEGAAQPGQKEDNPPPQQ